MNVGKKITALTIAILFSYTQISYPAEITQVRQGEWQPVVDPFAVTATQASTNSEPTDFFSAESPLSPPTTQSQTPAVLAANQIDVYEGQDLQAVIDSAQVGDVVFLHNGIYHGHFVLKDGVDLKGESRNGVVLNGDGAAGQHVVRAMGNNRIENLTITGSAAYAGAPSSAVRIEGNFVKVRNNNIIDNQGYGLYAWSDVGNILVEGNLIKNNHVGIQLPKDSNVIRYNTLIDNSIGINVLGGEKPRIEYNIIVGSTFSAIYEFSWGDYVAGRPSRGNAIVENNTFYNNAWHATAYGPSIPPAAENSTNGNITADPQFVNPSAGDYSIIETSSSWGRGAFVPQTLKNAMDRAAQFWISNEILKGLPGSGWRIFYAGGSYETFYYDGTVVLDTTGPTIELNNVPATNNPVLTNNAQYDLSVLVDGVAQTKHFVLQEGANTLTFDAVDELGNISLLIHNVTLDLTAPVVVLITQIPSLTNNPNLTVAYTVDGLQKERVFDLSEGINSGLTISEQDLAGNQVLLNLPQVVCDLTPPQGALNQYDLSDTLISPNTGWNVKFFDGVALVQSYSGTIYMYKINPGQKNFGPLLKNFFGTAGYDFIVDKKKLFIASTPLLGGKQIDVYDIDLESATFGQVLQTIANPYSPGSLDSTSYGIQMTVVGNYLAVADDSMNFGQGKIYLYDIRGNVVSSAPQFVIDNPVPNLSEDFGEVMSSHGNFLFVSERNSLDAGVRKGVVHIFNIDDASPSFRGLVHTFVSPIGSKSFGNFSVSIGQNILIADWGASDFEHGTSSGAVYLFNGDSSSPQFGQLMHTFYSPLPHSNDNFGVSVSVDQNLMLVGSHQSDWGATNSGAAFLFDGNVASATFGQSLNSFQNPTPGTANLFGFRSVLFNDSAIILGTAEPASLFKKKAFLINGGATQTSSSSVELTFGVSDQWTAQEDLQVAVSLDEGQTFGGYQSVSSQLAVELLPVTGNNAVVVRFKDRAGNVRDFKETIFYAPTVMAMTTVSLNASVVQTKSQKSNLVSAEVVDRALGRTQSKKKKLKQLLAGKR